MNLEEERFIDYTNLSIGSFWLTGQPPGLTIDSVDGISPVEGVLRLAFDQTDFDAQYPDLAVIINRNILFQSTAQNLISQNTLTVYPKGENPIAMITEDSILSEFRLDHRYLTMELAEEVFIGESYVTPGRFTLVNAPAGLSVEGVDYLDSRNIVIHLAFDGTDFDASISDFHIIINKDIHEGRGCSYHDH